MEWTITTEQGTEGTITLENLTLECETDFCDISMDVVKMSDDIIKEMSKTIHLTKINNNSTNISIGKYDRIWDKLPVVIDDICVYILSQNKTSYVSVGFHDAKNKLLEDNVTIPFNLMPGHLAELKTKIAKALVDNFF